MSDVRSRGSPTRRGRACSSAWARPTATVCLGPVLDALRDFDGTLVVAGAVPEGPRLVAREMFTDVDAVHALVDAVVTTGVRQDRHDCAVPRSTDGVRASAG